ncbi:complement regulator-acquiring protein (plasmid) [Borreliella californiensis]|uniref:Complement regulator-acquiring protein n=1 Tax=Borreliella californiensis TaxID=373543 RepID=A0A7W9ZLP8_9SPIR|nr:complement regulator-acquiring protein [Borreliella californiensis]MBB6213416.1 septal ring factor EnvC (AmiA/AmiB activator) [Borreliella californiensis]MBB6213425.1 septal ring factor EnvC (AmiA/AmiB activator) [Borreliella californiensis]WKC91321.1 complement regulator-acquiring protein [Borreliella californiensis]WNY70981.1 complement regulator-acquiring protein [Borreliella californiensis]
MTISKLNLIKLNIITMILTLICISCTANPIASKANENTISKNNTNLEENTQNFETTISELKTMSKSLEDQKNEESTQIAKIANEELDFLDTFKVSSRECIDKNQRMQTKRMIYSSLDYKKENIETLKKILETLRENPEHQNTAVRLVTLPWSIQFKIENLQFKIENHLASIQNKINNLNQEKSTLLLMEVKYNLQLKERFKKTLNETIEAYNNNTNKIKNDVKMLAEHVNKYYENSNSLKPIS